MIKKGQTDVLKRREAKRERTLTLLNRDVPGEDVLTISSSQNDTQTVGKERALLFSLCITFSKYWLFKHTPEWRLINNRVKVIIPKEHHSPLQKTGSVFIFDA